MTPSQGHNSTPRDVIIVGAARTPIGRLLGALSSVPATELGSTAIARALKQAHVDPTEVNAVIMGQVLQAGAGQNPTKQAALGAGIPREAHTVTVNKVCLSGLTAIIDAARMLRLGDAEVVVAGGMESMSQAPHLLKGSRSGTKYGATQLADHMEADGLSDAGTGISMGVLTEEYLDTYPVDASERDSCVVDSHNNAASGWERGVFDQEIAPVTVRGRKRDTVVERDEGIREGMTVEALQKLRPAFNPDGVLTAAHASQISDGAAAVVMCTRAYADEHGLQPLAVLRAHGQVAGPDASLQAQPGNAINQALSRQGWLAEDLDMIEINEAFADVVVHSGRMLGALGRDGVINPDGGAIAMGHPIGASGARLAVHAAHALNSGRATRAGIGLCGGGGQGEALLLEAP